MNKLWVTLLIPIFIMVDCNPSGIEIMMTYRFGCKVHIFILVVIGTFEKLNYLYEFI